MKVFAHLRYSALAKRALGLSGAFFLGTTALSIPVLPASANLSVFSSPRDKQARGSVPGRRRGGARRGTCAETQTQLVALVDAVEVETQTLPETYVGGTTTAEYPTFWFDVPYPLSSEITAEFVLQDNWGQEIYRATSAEFAMSNGQTPGIIGVPLPEALPPLSVGKTYQWYFKVDCGAESPLYVQGGVERIAPDPSLVRQLSTASPLEQAAIYQASEIWYDAVSAIAPLYLSQPNDPATNAAWIGLLQSLDLMQAGELPQGNERATD